MFADLTPEAFLDALSKGKGRTVLALQNSDPTLYTDALLQGCVENLQYDRQCEENRAEYMMRLLELAGLKEQARETILKTLPSTEEGWDRDWMIDLLEEFVREGDPSAWDTLRELASQGDERAQDNLAATGEAGLQWVEHNVLPNLPIEDRYRVGLWLPDEESDDTSPTQKRLREAANAYEVWRKARPKDKFAPTSKTSTFLRAIRAGKSPRTSPYEFAKEANRKELREAAEILLRTRDHRVAWRIAQVFHRRKFPLPLRRLFPHATHKERGAAVCRILGRIDAPQVRHFARRLIRTRPLPWNALSAFRSSFRKGEEDLISEVLIDAQAKSNGEIHDVVLDVVNLSFNYPDAAWQPHAEWIYEHSPCSFCRASAVDWMVEHGTIPAYIREEALYDAEPDIREAVLGDAKPSE